MVNFDDCKLDAFHSYGGSDKKLCRIFNGDSYMLKVADRISLEGNLAASYSNSIYSEYVCCHIISILGLDVQETVLGTVTTESQKTGEQEEKPVVGCKNFLKDNQNLIEFATIEDDALSEKGAKLPKLMDINYIFKTNSSRYLNSEKLRQKAERRYWDMFIIDAFLGNFDRHHNNWGYIAEKNLETGDSTIKLAPIYDCGSCLYPQIAEDQLERVLNSEDEINERVYKFPNAALVDEDGKKINYFKFINSLKNEDCNKALLRIYPLIKTHWTEIEKFILSVEEISEVRKKFYIVMLKNRSEKILEPAYRKIKLYNR